MGTYLDPPLLGFRLVEGRYAPVPASAQDGGLLTLRSEVLGLELRLTLGARRFGRRCTFTIRCAASTCEPTGKLTKRGQKRNADAMKRRERAGKPKTACVKSRRHGRRWKPRSGSCGSAEAETVPVTKAPPTSHCVATTLQGPATVAS